MRDAERGRPVRPVLLLETGGIRLQEANLGLLAIAEIHAAIVALRSYVPVVGVVAGMVGCFGGMSIAAGLCSHVVMTREGRLGLNGPQVIEQEAGVAELDSEDRRLVWETIGGEQRVATGMADALVEDDAAAIAGAVRAAFEPEHPWSTAAHRLGVTKPGWPVSTRPSRSTARRCAPCGQSRGMAMSRGRTWFEALAGASSAGEPASVLCADGAVGGERARFLAVVPDPEPKFPRARGGELGLEEGWTLARVRARSSGRGRQW